MTVNRFTELFENPSSFSRREATSFASLYYQRYIKNDRLLLKKIVGYLNTRAKHDHITVGEMSLLEFNLFGNSETIEDLSLIQHLQKLDLLASASLRFRKGRSTLDSQDLSSGEFHFLSTMIAIQATIRKNCLILIDEPETSLHPNWQMKYVDTLKQLFKEWNSCHFIMTTHSHFIISDLENDSSEIIGLKGQVPSIKAKPFNTKTYGYSAEEILLDIFEVSTTRNQFIYEKVGEILELIALPESNQDDIADKVKYLKQKGIDRLSKEDPLKEVIDKLLENMTPLIDILDYDLIGFGPVISNAAQNKIDAHIIVDKDDWGLSFCEDFKGEIKPQLARRQKRKCAYCRTTINVDGSGNALEHITPRLRKPHWMFVTHTLVVACDNCNSSKGTQNVLRNADVNYGNEAVHCCDIAVEYLIYNPHFEKWSDHFEIEDNFFLKARANTKGPRTYKFCGMKRYHIIIDYLDQQKIREPFSYRILTKRIRKEKMQIR